MKTIIGLVVMLACLATPHPEMALVVFIALAFSPRRS